MKISRGGIGGLGKWIQRDGPAPTASDGGDAFETALLPKPSENVVANFFGLDAEEEDFQQEGEGEQVDRSLSREGIPLLWCGAGASDLGLVGTTHPADLCRVMTHDTAPGGAKLAPESISEDQQSIGAYSVVWSAPKSISALLAHPDPDVRRMVTDAMRKGADALVQEFDERLTVRRGKAGVRSERIRGVVAAQALHQSSSAGDPHLHLHLMIYSRAASAVDGEFRAIDGRTFFQVQKLAEAAANGALYKHLEQHLVGGSWSAWVEQGSVPYRHIDGLEPVVEKLSNAHLHMEKIAQSLGVSLEVRSRKMDLSLWRRHRQKKEQIAEKLEHAIDEALHRGEDSAEFIREQWRKVINGAGASQALHAIKHVDQPKEVQSPAAVEIPVTPAPSDEAVAKARAVSQSGDIQSLQAALENLSAPSLKMRILGGLGLSRAAGEQIRDVQNQRENIETRISALKDAQETLRDAGKHEYAKNVLRDLCGTLGVFGAGDIVSRLAAIEQIDTVTASKRAAALIRYWIADGLLHPAKNADLNTICRVLENGFFSEDTSQMIQSCNAKAMVPDELLKLEAEISQKAKILSKEKRNPILVNLPAEFTIEQKAAAAMIAQGRALSVTVGVAGAGKTFLAKPIVDSAKKQRIKTVVLSRNRMLVENLKQELGCSAAHTFATFDPEEFSNGKTLIIVDEAGLIDQPDLKILLNAVEKNKNMQVWMLGDSGQAQAIDRKASFRVVEQSVDPDAIKTLSTSYRCQSWMEEHNYLRHIPNIDDAERKNSAAQFYAQQKLAQRALIHVDDLSSEKRYEKLAKLSQDFHENGEDAVVITRSNADAASISSYIQVLRGVDVCLETSLRYDQKAGIGDEIRTRKNDWKKGVRNGQTWVVVGIDGEGGLIVSRKGEKQSNKLMHLPKSYTSEFVELAYAVTADSAQGITVDRAIVDAAGMGVSLFYSASTRGRKSPVIVTRGLNPISSLSTVLTNDDTARTMREIADLQDRQARQEKMQEILAHKQKFHAKITELQNMSPEIDPQSFVSDMLFSLGFTWHEKTGWSHLHQADCKLEISELQKAYDRLLAKHAAYVQERAAMQEAQQKMQKELDVFRGKIAGSVNFMQSSLDDSDQAWLRIYEYIGYQKNSNGQITGAHPYRQELAQELAQVDEAWRGVVERVGRVRGKALETLQQLEAELRCGATWSDKHLRMLQISGLDLKDGKVIQRESSSIKLPMHSQDIKAVIAVVEWSVARSGAGAGVQPVAPRSRSSGWSGPK